MRSSPGAPSLAEPAPGDAAREAILAAAASVFAVHGFEGSSLRRIAEEAGVPHTLVLYHFRTKDRLWRHCVERLFSAFDIVMSHRVAEGRSALERLRTFTRNFVLTTARQPDLHRMMIAEGRQVSARLKWLASRFVKPAFERFSALAEAAMDAGAVPRQDPGLLFYALLGLGAHHFAVPAEVRLVTGRNPFDPQEAEAIAELTSRLLWGDDR